jgi:predicted  nucleic acid-binding Zn-ribbon protein
MEKFVSCFECGFDYSDVKEERCPKCGEEKIFIPKIHDPNFDIMKDPMELFKTRAIGAAIILGLLIAALIYTK